MLDHIMITWWHSFWYSLPDISDITIIHCPSICLFLHLSISPLFSQWLQLAATQFLFSVGVKAGERLKNGGWLEILFFTNHFTKEIKPKSYCFLESFCDKLLPFLLCSDLSVYVGAIFFFFFNQFIKNSSLGTW